MISRSEMEAVASGRAQTYALLAALYSAPPTEELAAMIRAGGLAQEEDSGSSLREAAEALTETFRKADTDGLPEDDIVAEHTWLFTLPSGVVPHESIYTDENQRMGGRVTVAVKQLYDAAAAELTGACLELPDHMGVELEFMQFLCDLERQFWHEPNEEGMEKCLDFQDRFLKEHLLCWHRALCEKIQNASRLEIYRALATLTIEFLEAERIFVPELVKGIHAEWRTTCASET